MISTVINLVMTVIGFPVSTMFIVFVCTRLIWARIQLRLLEGISWPPRDLISASWVFYASSPYFPLSISFHFWKVFTNSDCCAYCSLLKDGSFYALFTIIGCDGKPERVKTLIECVKIAASIVLCLDSVGKFQKSFVLLFFLFFELKWWAITPRSIKIS